MKHFVPFNDIPNDVIEAVLDRWVKGSRDRQIMKDKLIDKMTFESIAEKHELSSRYVTTVVYKLEMDIYEHLGL